MAISEVLRKVRSEVGSILDWVVLRVAADGGMVVLVEGSKGLFRVDYTPARWTSGSWTRNGVELPERVDVKAV